jgi:hypothetical protein
MQDWERASSAYAASLKQTLPQFPRPLQRLIKNFRLHDADVRSMTRVEDVLSITLQLDPPTRELLILSYTLIEPPVVNRSALPPEYRTEDETWLYDELALADPVSGPPSWYTPKERGKDDARVPVYTHEILFSHGWTVLLKFRKFKLSCPEALIPSPEPVEDEKEEPLTQSA